MVNIMTIKLLKKFTELLNRNEGGSIVPIIIIMVTMALIGGVFTSIMGNWKISAPLTINSNKAYYLAETAAIFALRDAAYRFYGGSFNYGTRSTPYVVLSSSTEKANYWFERPDTGFTNDDDTIGVDDDNVDDDADDGTNPTRYTILATGKASQGSITLATRQIKIKADITTTPLSELGPGVYTEGKIQGNGNSGYDMWVDGLDVSSDPASVAFDGLFPDSTYPPTSGSRTGIVHQPPGDSVPPLDEGFFKAMAIDQGHHYSGNLSPANNYPNGSYYYSGSVPNVTYVGGDLSGNGNKIIYGVYYVKGNVDMNGNVQLQGILICEGDVTANGGGNKSPNIYGGVIQYGSLNTLRGNGNPVEIQISDAYFSAMRGMLPSINIVSWQEAVSTN